MQFGIGHPPPTHQLQSTCVGRVQGSQIFKQNSIISIHFKVMAFLVILLSPWSPHCPHHPHVIPVIPTSSLYHPHIIPIAPRRSPCGPHGCGLRGLLRCLHGLHPMLSPWSPSSRHRPCHPHIIPVLSPSSPHHHHSPHKVPMWSPWLWSPWSPPLSLWSPPHVDPWSPSSQHHPRHPYVIPTSSRRSPHHP